MYMLVHGTCLEHGTGHGGWSMKYREDDDVTVNDLNIILNKNHKTPFFEFGSMYFCFIWVSLFISPWIPVHFSVDSHFLPKANPFIAIFLPASDAF
jgi:hypothetical protein